MIVGKNLGLELAQHLFHLCRTQFHVLLHLLLASALEVAGGLRGDKPLDLGNRM